MIASTGVIVSRNSLPLRFWKFGGGLELVRRMTLRSTLTLQLSGSSALKSARAVAAPDELAYPPSTKFHQWSSGISAVTGVLTVKGGRIPGNRALTTAACIKVTAFSPGMIESAKEYKVPSLPWLEPIVNGANATRYPVSAHVAFKTNLGVLLSFGEAARNGAFSRSAASLSSKLPSKASARPICPPRNLGIIPPRNSGIIERTTGEK